MNNPAINHPPLYILHHSECQRLHAEGMIKQQIAKHIGISDKTVRFSLASDEEKVGILARRQRHVKKNRPTYYGKPHNPPARPIVKRAPSQIISPEVKTAAVIAFAKYEITREQLMFRITPQDKWRGKSWEEA